MSKFSKCIKKIIHNPFHLFLYICKLPVFHLMPDATYVKLIYRANFGKKLNLSNPKTYNEKLQWLKLHKKEEKLTMLVDKYLVREFVSNKLGDNYLIPLLGVWNSFEEIDFDSLPNQFVLKPTHTSGDIFICKDKDAICYKTLKKTINKWLKRKYYWLHREWPYKNIKPRIIAEKLMVDESGYELKDYKFFCFDGKPKYMFVATDRNVLGEETKFDFYDMNFNHLPIKNGHENSKKELKCPASFDEMKRLAAILSQGFEHVRVDLYDINGRIYFGELTFYHWSGLVPFEPSEYDLLFGNEIVLKQ